jgi:hypothetical protein
MQWKWLNDGVELAHLWSGNGSMMEWKWLIDGIEMAQ